MSRATVGANKGGVDGHIEVGVGGAGGNALDNMMRNGLKGVDFIAVGELTHSVRVLDLGLDWEAVSAT